MYEAYPIAPGGGEHAPEVGVARDNRAAHAPAPAVGAAHGAANNNGAANKDNTAAHKAKGAPSPAEVGASGAGPNRLFDKYGDAVLVNHLTSTATPDPSTPSDASDSPSFPLLGADIPGKMGVPGIPGKTGVPGISGKKGPSENTPGPPPDARTGPPQEPARRAPHSAAVRSPILSHRKCL